MGPQRPPRRKLALATLAFVLTIAVLEGGSRLALLALGEPAPSGVRFLLEDVWEHETNPFHREDRDLLWRLIPGFSAGPVRVNELGVRGPAVEIPKPPGLFRLLALGDSITFGFGVLEEQTYAARLPALLELDRPVEVINAGVTGYSSWQVLRFYETVLQGVEPDLVTVMIGYPDHHYAVESDREKTERRNLEGFRAVIRSSGSYRLVRRLTGPAAPRLRTEPVARVAPDEFRENALRLNALIEEDGARALFLTVPLRRGIPFVENFTAVQEGGGTIWLRQLDFAIAQLGPDSKEPLARHFLGSGELDSFVSVARNCEKIRALTTSHPDLPIFHYLLGVCYRTFSKPGGADREFAESFRRDREREEMEAYNTVLRELAAESRIALLDLAEELPVETAGPRLFLDVAHPTPAGHEIIAAILAERIAKR